MMKVLALIAFAFVYAAAELPMQDVVDAIQADPSSDVRPICIDGGKIYKKGAQFYSKGCAKCTCHGANQISCLPSCPLMHVLCSSFEETKYKVHKINKRCSCKVPYCTKKTTCDFKGKTYKVGEKFIDEKICSSCQCTGSIGQICMPLCLPMMVNCRSDQVKKYKTVKRSPKCSCKVPYCKKMAGPHIMKDAPEAENTQEEEFKDQSADEEDADEEVADEEIVDDEFADEEVADEEVADEEVADEDVADEDSA